MSIETLTPLLPIRPIDNAGHQRSNSSSGFSNIPFSDILSQAMGDVGKAQAAAADDAHGLIMGSGDDLHSVMIRSAMEAASIETAVELTTRVVGAYKEIMQMQI